MLFNRDFLIIFIGKLLQVIIMILTIKVSTILLNPEQMGVMYMFMTIQTFFVFVFISPIGQYINRKTHSWENNQTIINNLFLFTIYILFIALLSIAVGLILYQVFGILNTMPLIYFLLFLFGFILFITLNQTIIPMLNMLQYRLDFTVLTILTSFGVLVLGFLLIYIYDLGSISWLGGILLSNSIFTIVGYIVLKSKIKNRFIGIKYLFKSITKEQLKVIVKISIPIAIATLFMWTQNSGYRIIIEQNISLNFLGFLGLGLAIAGQISSVVESIVTQYLSPIYYTRINNVSKERRVEIFNWLLNIKIPIYFLLVLYITFVSSNIVDILVDDKYKMVYIFTIFGIWIELFRMITNVLYTVSLSELKTKNVMFPYFVGSIVTIVLVYFSSINNNHELYLPISLIIGGFVTMLIMYYNMKKILPFIIDFKTIYLSFLLSIPYIFIYIYNSMNERFLFTSLIIVLISGLYFLLTVYMIYKRKFKC